MMKFNRQMWIFIPVVFGLGYVSHAQSPEKEPRQSIADHIRQNGRHQLVMPENIADLLLPSEDNASSSPERRGAAMRTFWRVQVFSDSKGERSHQEGQQKRSAVARKFPEYPIELKWDSPYWQLRVGKFTSRDEAETAAMKIKKAFPGYAREIHVVRQRMKDND